MSKENLQKFVDNLQKGDNKEAETNFKDAIGDKVSAALDDAKVDVAKSVFTGQQGVKAPEADVFSGNNIEEPAATEEVPASDEIAQ